MKTYHIVLIIIFLIVLCLISYAIGLSVNKPAIIIETNNLETIREVFELHGIKVCKVNIDGVYYFDRNDERIYVFGRYYRNKMRGKK